MYLNTVVDLLLSLAQQSAYKYRFIIFYYSSMSLNTGADLLPSLAQLSADKYSLVF